MRRLGALALAAVLGASCFGDRPEPRPPTAAEKPSCDALPGRAPEGFVLVRSRDVRAATYTGTHRTYRAPGRARLDVLLGAVGQVGEGMRLVRELELPSGAPARLMEGSGRWMLAWDGETPCRRNAIIGDGMDRPSFVEVLERMGLMG